MTGLPLGRFPHRVAGEQADKPTEYVSRPPSTGRVGARSWQNFLRVSAAGHSAEIRFADTCVEACTTSTKSR